MSFAAKGKKKEKKSLQIQDKQTPHTVLQKLSPKTTPPSLKENLYAKMEKLEAQIFRSTR